MENKNLYRQAEDAKTEVDNIIDALVSEIEGLEEERDALKVQITQLENQIDDLQQ